MATIAEIRAQGGQATVVSSPLAEPINAPLRFEQRLARFGDHYNTNQDSHLYKFLVSLCGDAGAGSLKREKLYPRLQQLLGSTYFQDIDKLYGNPLGISRLPAEMYIYDPHNEALTNEQWIEVFAKDASYRERCLTWMRAIIEGPTARGIAMAAEAAVGFECDVYETYNYIDNAPLNRPNTRIVTAGGYNGRMINDALRFEGIQGDGLGSSEGSYAIWQGATNLILNSNADNGYDNWSTAALAGHTLVSGATLNRTNTTYKFANSLFYTGTGVQAIDQGWSYELVGAAQNQGMWQTIGPSVSGQDYVASVWARASSTGQVKMTLGSSSGSAGLLFTPTTTWQQYSVGWNADGNPMSFSIKQNTGTAMDIFVDGMMVEASSEQIASPYVVGTREPIDIQLGKPDTFVQNESGWIAMKVKMRNASSDPLTTDKASLFTWRGDANTGYIRAYWTPSGSATWTIERADDINPVVTTDTYADTFAIGDEVDVTAWWTGNNIGITINADDAATATTISTPLVPVQGGHLWIGSDSATTDFMQGEVLCLIAGKGAKPTQAVLQPLLAASNPDLTTFPDGTTAYWNADSDNFVSTGTDHVVQFPITPTNTNSRNEFVVIPRVPDLEQKERRAISRLVDKLRPVDTIATIQPGQNLRNEMPILDVAASSTRFNILRTVTGNTNITWPPLDPAQGYWINTEPREAPTFAFLDRQESATYISVFSVEATSEHIGLFNNFQTSLFAHLAAGSSSDARYPASKVYAKAVAPLNVTTPWMGRNKQAQEKILVNNYYPLGYFTQINENIAIAENSFEFWASNEKFAPAAEQLVINLDVTRPFNFIDFNISQKPVDILIEYHDSTSDAWIPIEPKEGYEFTDRVDYLPSVANPWAYLEFNIDLIQADKIRITLTRREDTFPAGNPEIHPWSIEMQNLRVIHLIREQSDFVVDSGTDILGNIFETDIFEYEVGNVVDPDDPELFSFWQSQPNPTRHAVEALYFDLRDNSTIFTMAELDNRQMKLLDPLSMNDLTYYHSDNVILDEVWIDPITNGCDMHFYYSSDDTPDWDNKLWTPVPEHYKLRRGYFALPQATAVKYFKIEFSNLTPIPYQMIEYPTNITTKFRRYPTWVQNYFSELYPTKPYEESIEVVDTIKIDPLKYGYVQYQDAFNTGYESIRSELFKDTTDEVRAFIEDVVTSGFQQRQDTFKVESTIRFFSPLMWTQDLIKALDPTRAASRWVQKLINPLINESEWMSELVLTRDAPPVQKSVANLGNVADDLQQPILWFPRTVRHGYQLVEARFDNKIAYHVAISDVKFLRRDFSLKHDEEIYYETLEDSAHLTSNSLSQLDQYRWGAGEQGIGISSLSQTLVVRQINITGQLQSSNTANVRITGS